MSEPRRRVAVTGGTGLIGRVLADRLSDRYDLRLLGRDDADITDLDELERAFDGMDAVVHLAATAAVDSAWEAVRDLNLAGVYHAYEAARRAGVHRVVFASSNHAVGMYQWDDRFADPGAPTTVSVREPVRPDSLYGASKVWGEALGRYYVERHGLSVVCLRIGWVTRDDEPPTPTHPSRKEPMHVAERATGMWLSHRDCASLIAAAVDADVDYTIVHGVSDNDGRWLGLDEAADRLGWRPQDGYRRG